MNAIVFEWDDQKAELNARKHGIGFHEATSVFADPYARVFDDIDHSQDENRFIILGMSDEARVLVVCHAYRQGDTIRIISARKATHREAQTYERTRQ